MIPYSRMLAATLAMVICTSGLILSVDRTAHAAEVECVGKDWGDHIRRMLRGSGGLLVSDRLPTCVPGGFFMELS